MGFKSLISAGILAAQLAFTAVGYSAESAKTYQVTGPIAALTDKTVVVMKGDERWEIALDAATKSKAALRIGQKVTIHYRMSAVSIEVKDAGNAAVNKK